MDAFDGQSPSRAALQAPCAATDLAGQGIADMEVIDGAENITRLHVETTAYRAARTGAPTRMLPTSLLDFLR